MAQPQLWGLLSFLIHNLKNMMWLLASLCREPGSPRKVGQALCTTRRLLGRGDSQSQCCWPGWPLEMGTELMAMFT